VICAATDIYSCAHRPHLAITQQENRKMTDTTRRAAIATILATPLALSVSRAQAASHVVTIERFEYDPVNLHASVGDTVTFTNLDRAPHTATARDGSFDTGFLGRNDSASITVTSAGTFDYICVFHPGMTGTITVT
jgi:plastocyanin